jgi:hypothetical protein
MPEFGTETLQFASSGAAAVGAVGNAIECPFDADVSDVLVTLSAAADAEVDADVLVNGVSVFATPLGTIATTADAQTGGTGGIGTTDTTFQFDATDGSREVQNGEVILVGTEKMLVTGVTGSSQVSSTGTHGLYTVTVTRAYDGTSAAAHAKGVNVLPAKPFVPTGALKSGSEDQPYSTAGAFSISKGDVITAVLTAIGSTAKGADPMVEVVLTQR